MGQNKFKMNMRRLVALAISMTLVLSCAPMAFADGESGSCGDRLTWSLNAGTLTIVGSGAMTDFTENTMAPWYPYREEITKVVLPDGLTTIGNLAFYECSNLVSVVIPDSVTIIGNYAFANCTGMEFMTMGSGVTHIKQSAFECCESLTSVRLPNSLKSLGFRAFYRCSALTAITIPASVTNLGMTVFGYCESLVRADIQAGISEIPEWFFYGCTNLSTVVLTETVTDVDTYAFKDCDNLTVVDYPGSSENAEKIKQEIMESQKSFSSGAVVSGGSSQESTTTRVEEKDGNLILESTTTVETENATVGSTTREEYSTETGTGTTSTTVNATVENQDGWKDVEDQVQNELDHKKQMEESGNTSDKINVNVYIKDDTQLTQDVLNAYAGKDVNLTVRTETGSSWVIDCTTLEVPASQNENKKGSATYDLSYELLPAPEKIMEELGGASAYTLKFNSSAKINAQFVIQLSTYHIRQNAFLYQRVGGKLERLQGVVVDANGLANFYLASVDEKTEYVIGINVPGEDTSDVVVPQSLAAEYGILQDLEQRQYTITGRESSWGMNINQVTWIMIGGMTAVVVTVGFVMYLLNKRKLRMGYVPDLDEEFE